MDMDRFRGYQNCTIQLFIDLLATKYVVKIKILILKFNLIIG